MTVFHDNSHLTDQAFHALLSDDNLSELERLEIAEHLAYCDCCVERYAALLDDSLLLSPDEPLAPTVLSRIKERARKIFLSKYTTVIAAASFAILFWNIGVFNVDVSGNGKILSLMSNSSASFSSMAEDFSETISKTVQQLLRTITFERGSINHEKK